MMSRGLVLALRTPFGMCIPFVCILGIFAVARSMLWTYGTDTGIFLQASASALHGYLDGPEAGTHFCYHWSPIIGVLSPLVWLLHASLTIEIAQVFIIGAAVFPLYALVRRYADEKTAFFAGLWTLIYAPLFSIACEEFHELAFYPVLALLLIDTADRRAWFSFALTACAAVLVREDALMVNVACGLLLIAVSRGFLKPLIGAQMRGDRAVAVAGAALAILSLLVMYGYFYILIPAIGSWTPTHFYTYSFADGPRELLIALAKNPLLIGHFLTLGRATYLLEAFAPLLFLSFRSSWMLVSIPGFLVILLSNSGVVWRMGDQYAALWIPWVLLAAMDGMLGLQAKHRDVVLTRYRRAVTAALVAVIFFFNPAHPIHYLRPTPNHKQAMRALALVPHDAYVWMHDEWYSHVALDYPHATVYTSGRADWVVVDEQYPSDMVQHIWLPLIAQQRRAGILQQIARFDTVVVYRRRMQSASI